MRLIQTLLVIATLAAPLRAQASSEVALRAAIETETVTGDIKGALRQYAEVAAKYAKSDRATAASALVHIAECYEKMGKAEASKIYERVIREYPDQNQTAALARKRLGRGGERTTQAEATDRVVWRGPMADDNAQVSPDGRYIAYVDWNYTGNLILHDVQTGTDHPLTDEKSWADWKANATSAAFSKDGKQLAYGWWTQTAQRAQKGHEIWVVDLGPGGAAGPRRKVFAHDDVSRVQVMDWSPDRKWLAVEVTRMDRTKQIALVSVEGGALQVLRTIDWRGANNMFFSPDSKYIAYDLPVADTGTQRDVFVMAVDGSQESAIAAHPDHDIAMSWTPDGAKLLFGSTRGGAMGLWEVAVANGKQQGAPVMLKRDIGALSSLGLSAAGTLYIFRDASTTSLQTAALNPGAVGTPGPSTLGFSGSRADWTPDGKYVAFRSMAADGSHVITIRADDSGQVRIIRPGLTYFNDVRWLPDGRSLVTMGTDLKGKRGIFRVDAASGATSLILAGSSTGRIQVSPDGKFVYYTTRLNTSDEAASFMEHDLASGKDREVFRPAKLAMSPEVSPDGRYVAAVLADKSEETSTLTVYPVQGGAPRELLQVRAPEGLNGYGGLTWSHDSRSVLVVRTNTTKQEVWQVPLQDGAPRKLDIKMDGWEIGSPIRAHPQGGLIAFVRGNSAREVWALENVVAAAKTKR